MVQDDTADPSTADPSKEGPSASDRSTSDRTPDRITSDPSDAPRTGRALLVGGVALACAAGAGVGLWARPSEVERPGATAGQPAALPMKSADRRLAIVVDDTPAPVGKPLDVLSHPAPAPARPPQVALPPDEPVAPRSPPEGLVRVVAPAPGPLAVRSAPPPPVRAEPAPRRPVRATAEKPTPKAAARMARTGSAKARAERRKPDEVDTAASSPAPKSRHGLSAIAHALAGLAPHHAKAASVEEAKAKPRRKAEAPQVAKATSEKKRARLAGAPSRCASADPGEALACGDPGLGAAERRLNRAYREAAAAGVPPAVLERQQQRWRAARAAAAREAPWAVREVYQARIAELQDLTRDARGD